MKRKPRKPTRAISTRKDKADLDSAYEVIDEIRALRAKLWKQGGGTYEGFIAAADKMAAERAACARPTRRRSA